jgi:hypothetical protein
MTGKAEIRDPRKSKAKRISNNSNINFNQGRGTSYKNGLSAESSQPFLYTEGDLNLNTYDIINVDRMLFATAAGSGDTIAATDYGIEAIANGASAPYGITYQIPAGKIHTFNVGSVGALVVSDSAVVATVDMTTANINLGGFKIKYSEISTPSPNPAANEGFMYAKDVSGVTTPMWLDSAGTETSLLGGGSSGWVGTATSTLDMNNFNIEDVNVLKINSGSAGSADSFTMFGTSSAGALNLVDDNDFFDFQVDGDSKFRMYDDRIEINEPLRTTVPNTPNIGEPTYPFGTVYAQHLNSSSTLTVTLTSVQLGNISTNGQVKGFSGVIGLQCTDDTITKGTQGTVQIPELYNNSEPSATDLNGWFGNADGCIGIMRTASQTRLYARSGSTWKYEILS